MKRIESLIILLVIACSTAMSFGQTVQTYKFKRVLSSSSIDIIADGLQYPVIVKDATIGTVSKIKLTGENQYRIRYQGVTGVEGLDTIIYLVYNQVGAEVIPTIEAYILELENQKARDDYYETTLSVNLELLVLENDIDLNFIEDIIYQENAIAEISEDGQKIHFQAKKPGMAYLIYYACSDQGCSKANVQIRVDHPYPMHDTLYLSADKNESVIVQVPQGFNPLSTYTHNDILIGLSDQRYRYIPLAGFTGNKLLKFVKEPGPNQLEYFVQIDYTDPFLKNGWSADDIFYTEVDHPLDFNVLTNDLVGNITSIITTEIRGSILQGSEGQFTYIPESGFNGLTYFQYVSCAEGRCDTAEVNLAVHNFAPAQDVYNFSIGKNDFLELPYPAPIDEFRFEIQTDASAGIIELADVERLVVYSPIWDFTGEDYFLLDYCVGSDCHTIRINVAINEQEYPLCFDNCVWPGDANSDGIVNHEDAVVLGANFGLSGPGRDDVLDDQWYARSVDTWAGQFTIGASKPEMIDANGDGKVSVLDSSVIHQFYRNVHQLTTTPIPSNSDYLQFEITNSILENGEIAELEISLGSVLQPIQDLIGISFTVELDGQVVDSETFDWELFDDAWLSNNSGVFQFNKSPEDGVFDIGVVRTNREGISGYGTIGKVSFTIDEDVLDFIELLKANRDIKINIKNISVLKKDGLSISLPSQLAEFTLLRDKKIDDQLKLMVYPNPSQDNVQVHFDDYRGIQTITIYNLEGQPIKTVESTNEFNRLSNISLANLQNGLYLLEVRDNSGIKVVHAISVIR